MITKLVVALMVLSVSLALPVEEEVKPPSAVGEPAEPNTPLSPIPVPETPVREEVQPGPGGPGGPVVPDSSDLKTDASIWWRKSFYPYYYARSFYRPRYYYYYNYNPYFWKFYW